MFKNSISEIFREIKAGTEVLRYGGTEVRFFKVLMIGIFWVNRSINNKDFFAQLQE